jgi:hypothetical protein
LEGLPIALGLGLCEAAFHPNGLAAEQALELGGAQSEALL